jgi:hypothetical protein
LLRRQTTSKPFAWPSPIVDEAQNHTGNIDPHHGRFGSTAEWGKFAMDSPLEGDGFEPSVPGGRNTSLWAAPLPSPLIRLPQRNPTSSRQGPTVRIHLPPGGVSNKPCGCRGRRTGVGPRVRIRFAPAGSHVRTGTSTSFPAPGRPSDGLVVWSFTGGRVSALVLLWLSWFITVPSISHLSADSVFRSIWRRYSRDFTREAAV